MASSVDVAVADPCAPSHLAVFYEREAFLTDVVTEFLGDGLRAGEGGLVIATPEHRERFLEALDGVGCGPGTTPGDPPLVLLDAERARREVVRDGVVDPGLFRTVIGEAFDLVAAPDRPVRVFGEIVALLRDDGEQAAALALEDLWNGLARERDFSLLCGYPLGTFGDVGSTFDFVAVCERHSAVANEHYACLGERGRAGVFFHRGAPSAPVDAPAAR